MGIPVSQSETKVSGLWPQISIWDKIKTKFINQNIHLAKRCQVVSSHRLVAPYGVIYSPKFKFKFII